MMDSDSLDEEEEFLLLLAFALAADEEEKEKRKRKKRRVWSHQAERLQQGEQKVLMELEKKSDPDSFFGAYGMTPDTFDELLLLLGPHIVKATTTFRDPVGAAERLGITLRYLATGMSQKQVAQHFSVSRPTTCNIIQEVCKAVWEVLGPQFMAKPTTDDWRRIAKEFHSRWDFPNCLGAINSKQIQIQSPRLSGSHYHKKINSVVLMGVADATYSFTYLDVGSYTKENNSIVLGQSSFGKGLQDGTLSLPEANGTLPYVFVSDEAFPLKPHIMCPYPEDCLTERKEKIYNYRLSRAQKVVENAFAIMVTKWHILRHPIVTKPENVDCIIKAVGVLHNFLREKETQNVDIAVANEIDLPDVSDRLDATRCSSSAESIRESFAYHFSSPQGSLPHQNDIVD